MCMCNFDHEYFKQPWSNLKKNNLQDNEIQDVFDNIYFCLCKIINDVTMCQSMSLSLIPSFYATYSPHLFSQCVQTLDFQLTHFIQDRADQLSPQCCHDECDEIGLNSPFTYIVACCSSSLLPPVSQIMGRFCLYCMNLQFNLLSRLLFPRVALC